MINHPGASRIQSHASSSFGMRGVGRSGRSSDEELFINTDYQNRNQSYRISLTFLNEIHNLSNWVFKLGFQIGAFTLIGQHVQHASFFIG